MAAKRKLPDIDAFGAMLDRAFPSGPLSDVSDVSVEPAAPSPEPKSLSVPALVKPQPVPVLPEPAIIPQSIQNHVNETRSGEPLESSANNQPPSDGVLLDSVTVTPLDRQTVMPSHGKTVTQSDGGTVKQLDGQTARQLNADTVKQSTPETGTQVSYQTTKTVEVEPQQHYQTVSYQTIPLDVLTLPYNQAVILEYLIGAGGITNARAISDATHIGIPSVRDAIARLIRRGFMPNPVTIKNAAFQGFSYILNQSMVAHFQAAGGLEQRSYTQASNRLIADRQTVSESNGVTVGQPHRQTAISSSNKTELTTTPGTQTVSLSDDQTVTPSTIAPSDRQAITPPHSQTIRQSDSTPSDAQINFILTGPTGMYWEGEGLQERQAKTWCDQFEIEPIQMKQQLEWARFDLVANNKATEVKKDTISWFFGALRQTGGCYPKPSNYKSPAEIRAEQMEQAVRETVEARQRQTAAEQEMVFQRIISDQNCAEYQSLFGQVSDFAREIGGKALETALREAFDQQPKGATT